ncbi:hypothetical protein SAMN05428988_0877 [Chitinophaga sp. YR573]|nr:hypothetical protein SAMN05428988_0877 [Chitinophaga sp. YR573]
MSSHTAGYISGSFFLNKNNLTPSFLNLPSTINILVSVLNSCFQYSPSCVSLHVLALAHNPLYRLPLHVVIYILCLIIALFSRIKNQRPHYFNSFILYILLTITIEVIAWWYSLHRKNNLIFYNFYTIINFTYLIYLMRSFLQNRKVMSILTWVAIVYPVFASANMIFFQGLHTFNTYSFICGCTLTVIASIAYFYERIKHSGPQSLLHDPTFWISTGILFYNTCSLPMNGILNVIANVPLYVYKIIYSVNVVMNIILYLLFSISFVCNLIFRKSS